LFYGIYMNSGRALHLNTLYIYEKQFLTLYTDKQVYNIGDTATIYIETNQSGNLSITAPGYIDELLIDGNTILTFTVPELKSGTYYIEYSFNDMSSSYPFDVDGYSARITEFSLDRETYMSEDPMYMEAKVHVNREFNGFFKAMIYNPEQQLIGNFEVTRPFVTGENHIQFDMTLITGSSGIHMIAYRVYLDLGGQNLVPLASGVEYFDATTFVVFGDSNGDSMVNVFDITKAARIILEFDDPTPGADANQDGEINIFDITKIVRIILELD
jgi:hypothetical protein